MDRFHGKEVAGQDLFFVMRHQLAPTVRSAANWRRYDTVAFKHIADRCPGSLKTQLQEFAFDLAILSAWILTR